MFSKELLSVFSLIALTALSTNLILLLGLSFFGLNRNYFICQHLLKGILGQSELNSNSFKMSSLEAPFLITSFYTRVGLTWAFILILVMIGMWSDLDSELSLVNPDIG